MASLRDQLLKKGLVDKKRKRKIERELRQKRKQDQGERRASKELAREAEETARAERVASAAARAEERRRQREREEAMQHRLRARNLILGNRVNPGRGHRFFYPKPDGCIGEVEVSSGVAFQLRCGQVGLAQLEDGSLDEVFVVKRKAAEALQEAAPSCVRLFVVDPEGLSAPDLAFHQRDWPTELGPHRATDEDLARFRAADR